MSKARVVGWLLMVGVAALFVYSFLTRGPASQFGYLAQSFLHGHLDVPGRAHDLVIYKGRSYIATGPLPAVLLMPLVLIYGPEVRILYLGMLLFLATPFLLFRLWEALGLNDNNRRVWMTLGAMGGTVLLSCAVGDSTVLLAHEITFLFLCGALVVALEGRAPFVGGLLISGAVLTRNNALLAVVPIAALYLSSGAAGYGMRSKLQTVALLGAGVGVSLVVSGWYNAARFGSPLENGYAFQLLGDPALEKARDAGLFSVRHLPKSLYYFLLAGPEPYGKESDLFSFPWLKPSLWGMGIMWVSPWLLLFRARVERTTLILLAGFILMLSVVLLYYGIGWKQFGFRYALDSFPFLISAVALGYEAGCFRRALPSLVTYSVLVNIWGTFIFRYLLVQGY